MTATQNTMIWGSAPSTTCLKLWEYVSDIGGQDVLILGAGDGRNAKFLASQNFSVVCVDPDPKAISELESWAKTEGIALKTFVSDYDSFELSDQFDIVLSVGAIKNVDRDSVEKLFSKIAALTKPSGYNAISVFIDKPFINLQERRELFCSGDLMSLYGNSLILWTNQELFRGDSDDLYCVDRIIAKILPAGHKLDPEEVTGALSLI